MLDNIIMHAIVDAKEFIIKTTSVFSSIALLADLLLEKSKNTSLNPSDT